MNPTIDWHNLSGKQVQAFMNALLHAFPQRGALAQMLKFNMDLNLDHIASSGNMQEIMFQLIEWSQASGRAEELFNGALEAVPGSPALNGLAEEFSALAGGTSGAKSSAYSAPPAQTAAGERGFATSGDVSDSTIITGDGNVITINTDGGAASNDGRTTPPAKSEIVDLWREKLDYFQRQEVITTDPNQKFALKKQIEEIEAKILELS